MTTKCERAKICFVVNDVFFLNAFLVDVLNNLATEHDVTIITNAASAEVSPRLTPAVTFIDVPIQRQIRPLYDAWVLLLLLLRFKRNQFDVVHSLTPKAGLLAMLAAKMTGAQKRCHTYTGQVWVTKTGFMRLLLWSADRMVARMANHRLTDSLPQFDFLQKAGIVTDGNLSIIGNGSVGGVDLQRFSPNPARRRRVREECGFAGDTTVFLYLGRVARDKGVLDLAIAFSELSRTNDDMSLLLVGPDEENLIDSLRKFGEKNTLHIGLTSKPENFLDACDVLVLPSFREGVGTVVLEAGAMAKPVIATDIYGLASSVVAGETGTIVPAGDTEALKEAMLVYKEPTNRMRHGAKAQILVANLFSAEYINQAWLDYYNSELLRK